MKRIDHQSVDGFVDIILSTILSTDPSRAYLRAPAGATVALLVNNLGGTSNLELGVVIRAAVRALRARGLRALWPEYMPARS